MRFCTAILAMLLWGCASPSDRLGQGYRIVHRSKDMRGVPGAFEALTHYSDLYYREQRLGTIGQYSISPSGRFALFEDTGKLMLFDRQRRKIREVTDGFAIPRSFTWSESAGFVDIVYYERDTPSHIALGR